MALKHGSLALPSGITATGIIINRVRKADDAVKIIEKDETGKFAAGNGKVLVVETKLTIEGKCKSTASLPDAGSGGYTSASPLIQSVEVTDENEGASGFSIGAEYETDKQDDF